MKRPRPRPATKADLARFTLRQGRRVHGKAMSRRPCLVLAPLGALLLSGCLAKTALDVVTAPVKVAGKAVDMATTSQSEADEKRGRELRKREERYGKLERDYRKQAQKCDGGEADACRKSDEIRGEMDRLRPSLPAEQDR